jgi:DNA-binding PadR family transcriptional regulator
VPEKNPTTDAELLRLLSTRREGVQSLAREINVGPARLIRLLSELEESFLIDSTEVRSRRAGRPKRRFEVTALGREYLRACEAAEPKRLKSRRADLRRAVADAEYAQRLASRGVSTTDLFLELTSLVQHAGSAPG